MNSHRTHDTLTVRKEAIWDLWITIVGVDIGNNFQNITCSTNKIILQVLRDNVTWLVQLLSMRMSASTYLHGPSMSFSLIDTWLIIVRKHAICLLCHMRTLKKCRTMCHFTSGEYKALTVSWLPSVWLLPHRAVAGSGSNQHAEYSKRICMIEFSILVSFPVLFVVKMY